MFHRTHLSQRVPGATAPPPLAVRAPVLASPDCDACNASCKFLHIDKSGGSVETPPDLPPCLPPALGSETGGTTLVIGRRKAMKYLKRPIFIVWLVALWSGVVSAQSPVPLINKLLAEN